MKCFKKLKKLVRDMKAVGRHVGRHEFLRAFVACPSVDKSLGNYLAFNMGNATIDEVEQSLRVKDSHKFKDGTRPGLKKRDVKKQWAKLAEQNAPWPREAPGGLPTEQMAGKP